MNSIVMITAQLPGARLVGTSTRAGGCSRGVWESLNLGERVNDDPAHVAANLKAVVAATGATAAMWLDQVHGAKCVHARIPGRRGLSGGQGGNEEQPEADAVWTDEPGLLLGIRTADCVPVLVADRQGRCVGAAHAGWQGLEQQVIGRLIEALPVPSGDLSAWIGPAICQVCYEVDAPVWTRFTEYERRLGSHPTVTDKRLLDLPGIAEDQLLALGVASVTQSGLCSYTDERFYSHRRATHLGQPNTGRMASFVML